MTMPRSAQDGTDRGSSLPLPLAGMRVVEVSSFVAAPLGGMALAQLGADVVRVDPLGGAPDHSRWPLAPSGTSLYWAGLNNGKKSVAVDFRSPEGQQLVARLVQCSGPDGGIVLTNAVGSSWLSYGRLVERRPELIHVQIEGHHEGSPAVDYTVNASVGFPMVTGPEGHAGPVNHVLPAWDMACGLYAALGILSADRQCRITGRGQRMSVALHDVALAMAGNLGFLAEAQVNGVQRQRQGNHLYGSFARDFTIRDGGRVMVVALTGRHWRSLVEVAGLRTVVRGIEESLGADFSQEGDRYTYREVLAGLLQRWFSRHDLAEVETELAAAALLWSTYRTFAELVGDGDGSIRSNPMIGCGRPARCGSVPGARLPRRTRGACPAGRPTGRAPVLGEHTEEVLGSRLGLSAAAVADLRDRGIVRAAEPPRSPASARPSEGAGDGPG